MSIIRGGGKTYYKKERKQLPFEFQRAIISDVILVKPKIFSDDRGFFFETYKKSEFKKAGIDVDFIQCNHSKSCKGVIRGLHFQREPYSQSKLVRCLHGRIFDVAVDLRKDSKYFGKYVSFELSGDNKYLLFIPQGFAHGFQVVSKDAEIEYLVDNEYAPGHEEGIMYNDETIGIKWPIQEFIVSEKDQSLPKLVIC
jgi:dTDP-4-dehydrorhamnose 3,5-epimerase